MNKNKVYIYLCIISIVLTIFFISCDIKDNKLLNVFTPITGRKVVIDAGHGKPDEGAIGYLNTTEQKLNLEISQKLQNIIEQTGGISIITRSTEEGIYSKENKTIKSKKVSDIKNRVKIINGDTDILVSIHLNKFNDSRYKGWQVFYKNNCEKSKLLANKIQDSLNKNISEENKRVPKPITGIYIMNKSKIPSVIVECGFISNPDETQKLKDYNYQNKIAWGIYFGIQDYFREEKNE